MAYYRINGGKRLEGAVTISGAKNAALAITGRGGCFYVMLSVMREDLIYK